MRWQVECVLLLFLSVFAIQVVVAWKARPGVVESPMEMDDLVPNRGKVGLMLDRPWSSIVGALLIKQIQYESLFLG